MNWDYQNFMGERLTLTDAKEFNGQTIVGSCFPQEGADVDVFPEDMTGVTFVRCNLDNCNIPPGNTVDPSCLHRRIRVQNDGDDWVVNERDEPTEPLTKASRLRNGESIDPKDIPAEPIEVS